MDTWRLPWELLGLPVGAAAPRHVAVRIAPPDALLAERGGLVLGPEAFVKLADGRIEPVRGGLYDEDVFGPIPRATDGGADLSAFDAKTFARRPQIRRPGEILLEAPVLSPWLRRHALDRVAAQAGAPLEVIEGLLSGALGLMPSLEPRPVERVSDPDGVLLGAAAIWQLARRHRPHLEGFLRALSVLPAGLRAPRLSADESRRVEIPGATFLYQALITANRRVESCLLDHSPPRELAQAIAKLQSVTESLFLDGVARDGSRPLPGQVPAAPPLARAFTGSFGAACITDLASVSDPGSFVLALRGSLYIWRAHIEASGLEIVFLGPDGSVDERTRRQILTDKAASRFEAIYREQLGEPWIDSVVHGPDAGGLAHVDVYPFAPSAARDHALFITAGMSTRLMIDGDQSGIAELACFVRPDIGEDDGVELMQSLLRLALDPFRNGKVLRPGSVVRFGGPLIADTRLTAWIVLPTDPEGDDEWAARLSDNLTGHPEIFLAAAVTDEELELTEREGLEWMREHLESTGKLWIDPRRAKIH